MKQTSVLVIILSLLLAQPTYAVSEKFDSYLASKLNSDADELSVIVVLNETGNPGKTQSKVISSLAEGKVKHRYNLINGFSAKLGRDELETLGKNPLVQGIYYDAKVHALPVPDWVNAMDVNAKLYTSTNAIGAVEAWSMGYTGRNVTVAVVDSGIDYTHPSLGNCTSVGVNCRVKGGYDFVNTDSNPMDDNGHGTHVAGIVGMSRTVYNGYNLSGVAPNVTFYALKVLNAGGSGSNSDVIAAMDWAVSHNADIITLSLGTTELPNNGLSIMSIVSDAAVERGVVVTIAAGNEGPGAGTIDQPGDAKKVITVGSANDHGTDSVSDDDVYGFYHSNRGPSMFGRLDPDVVAPGYYIQSTKRGGGFVEMSGSSMATPHVAGAAALLLDAKPNLTAVQVRSLLMHTATKLSTASYPVIHPFEQGSGEINVSRAITQTIDAQINNDDRWEFTVVPGLNATTQLVITNSGNVSLRVNLSVDLIADVEYDNNISALQFVLPNPTLVDANANKTLLVTFSAPLTAKPGTYGTILTITANNSQQLRIPVVITIPLFGSGIISGTVDDECDGDQYSCGPVPSLYAPGEWGDFILHLVKSHNGTSFTATLNWTNSADDLDFYVYSSSGKLVTYSGMGGTNYENITIASMAHDEYWLVVYAYDIITSSPLHFNVTVRFGSQFEVNPDTYQTTMFRNQLKSANFSITNHGSSKTVNVSVLRLQPGGNETIQDSVSGGGTYNIEWRASTSAMSFTNAKYLTATLRWPSSSRDLEMCMYYYSGSWYTIACSQHSNSDLGEAVEELENIDIEYYLKTYSDIGIGISNSGISSYAYNLTLNLTSYLPWNATSVSTNSTTFGSNENKNLTVTINSSGLEEGRQYDAYLALQGSNYAWVPVSIYVKQASLRLNSPSDNAYTSNNSVMFSYTPLMQNNLTGCSLYGNFNGSWALNQTDTNVSNNNPSFFTLTLPEGTYLWNVKCTDTTGNSTFADGNFTLTIDNTPPTSYVMPLSMYKNSESFAVTFNGTDNSGIYNYTLEYKISGGNWTYFGATTGTSITFNGTGNLTHYFRAIATDRAGNSETDYNDTGDAYTTIDITPPVVVITSPNGTFSGMRVVINVTFTDNLSGTNESSFRVYLTQNLTMLCDNSDSNASNYANCSSGVCTCSWRVPLLNTTYNISAYGADNAGNSRTNSACIIAFSDSDFPELSNQTPSENSYVNLSNPIISATILDYTGVNASATLLFLDGTNVTSNATINSTNILYQANGLGDGMHNVSVYLADTLNNSGFSNWSFTVDATAPQVLSQTPANNATIQGLATENFSVVYTESNLNRIALYWKLSNNSSYAGVNLTNCLSGTAQTCSTIFDLSGYAQNAVINYYFAVMDLASNTAQTSVINITIKKLVVINEFLPKPNATGVEWIELYNKGYGTVDLRDWTLSFTAGDRTLNIRINANYYMDEYVTLNAIEDHIILRDKYNVLVDNISYSVGQQFGNLTYNGSSGFTIGRFPDGSDEWTVFNESAATRGASNAGLLSRNISLMFGWNLISLPLMM